jgi:hypothetical protein
MLKSKDETIAEQGGCSDVGVEKKDDDMEVEDIEEESDGHKFLVSPPTLSSSPRVLSLYSERKTHDSYMHAHARIRTFMFTRTLMYVCMYAGGSTGVALGREYACCEVAV